MESDQDHVAFFDSIKGKSAPYDNLRKVIFWDYRETRHSYTRTSMV